MNYDYGICPQIFDDTALSELSSTHMLPLKCIHCRTSLTYSVALLTGISYITDTRSLLSFHSPQYYPKIILVTPLLHISQTVLIGFKYVEASPPIWQDCLPLLLDWTLKLAQLPILVFWLAFLYKHKERESFEVPPLLYTTTV